MRKDIYQRVTDSIVAELERGVRPWLKPWNAKSPGSRLMPGRLAHGPETGQAHNFHRSKSRRRAPWISCTAFAASMSPRAAISDTPAPPPKRGRR